MFDMFLSLLSNIAQSECEKIKERQRQGTVIAKKAGHYKGRPAEYTGDSVNSQKKLVYEAIVLMLEEEWHSRQKVYKTKRGWDISHKS